jgi:LPXTG-motif cell wall-anchored protein
MMMSKKVIKALAATAALLAMTPTTAQELSCEELEFDEAILEEFPRAQEYCMDVAEREGKPYAHFIAEVERVRGNTVSVRFKTPDGELGEAVAFTPPSDFRVQIDGRGYTVRQLERGQELDVWVPEDRWHLATHDTAEDLETATELAAFEIEEPETSERTTLPATASPWPTLALLGGGLMLLAAALRLRRRR